MARGRMLDRKIAIDERFNQLKIEDQWLFMRILPFLDDHGRTMGNLFELKCQVIPSTNWNVDRLRDSIKRIEALELVQFAENEVLQFNGFSKHQKIGHRLAESKFPAISEVTGIAQERSGKVEKGRERSPQYNIIQSNISKDKLSKDKLNKYKAKPKDLGMIVDYFKEMNIVNPESNAQLFWDHYEKTGWYAGKNKIRSWRHCLSSWNFTARKTKTSLSDFKTTAVGGHFIGYCDKCGVSDFYDKFEVWQDSRCCQSGLLPKKVEMK